MSRVFRKTAQGRAILTKPNSGVTSFERALLTLIDGKRDASDIRRRLATFGNVNAVLRELFEDGLIEFDPEYATQFATIQNEIARENVALGGNFGNTTTATIGKGANLPRAKRDLRDALPPLDSVPTVTKPGIADMQSTLPRDPWSDEVRTPAISAWAMDRAKDFARQFIFKAVGVNGTSHRIAVESAFDVKEFLRATQAASTMLHAQKGAAVGAEFDRRLHAVLYEH